MNKNFRKSQYTVISLIALFAIAHAASLPAQILVGNQGDKGDGYGAREQDRDLQITFTSPGGKVDVSPSESYFPPPNTYTLTWTGPITMNAPGTFYINNARISNTDINVVFALEGNLTGSGDLIKTGNGTFVLNSNANASNFRGKLNIEGGTFEVGPAGSLSERSTVTLANGAVLDISTAGDQTIASLTGSTGTAVKFGNGRKLTFGGDNSDTVFSGELTGGNNSTIFEKVGDGTFDFSNGIINSSFTGTFQVSEGTFRISNVTGTFTKVIIKDNAAFALGIDPKSFEEVSIANLVIENGGKLSMRIDELGNRDQIRDLVTAIGTIEVDAIAGKYDGTHTYVLFTGPGLIVPTSASLTLKQKFLDESWNWSTGTLTINGRIPNFFTENVPGMSWNQMEVGKALDKTSSLGLWEAMTRISGAIDDGEWAKVRSAYDQMSGDLLANSMMLGQWQTSRYGLNHLDLTDCGVSQGNGFWVDIVHQTTNFESDGNSGDYGISRSGFVIGSEERRVDVTYGFFVGYSYPFLYDHGDKVTANDLQFGFYGGSKVGDVLDSKLFVGYGHQGYKSKRFITNELLVDQTSRIGGKYCGDSMSMALELGLPLGEGFFCVRPVAAIDSDLTWQYGFSETGSTGLELWHDRSFLNRSFVRTGLTAQLGSIHRCDTLSLQGRFYYGYQVFGDSYPESRNKFASETGSDRMMIHGVDPGKDYVNLGLGLRWNIDSTRAFYGDYDFNAMTRSTAHWGTLGFMQKW